MKYSATVFLMCLVGVLLCGTGSGLALDEEDVNIHGFLGIGYLYTGSNDYLADTKDGTMEFNEIGLNFSVAPAEKLSLAIQLFSRDLGNQDNNRIDVDFAFGDYHWRDELGVRLGRTKNPHGLYFDTIDLDVGRTSVFLPLTMYFIRLRSYLMTNDGINIYGNLPLGPVGAIEYQGYYGIQQATSDLMLPFYEPILEEAHCTHPSDIFGGRLLWRTPLDGLIFASSYVNMANREVIGPIKSEFTTPVEPFGSLYPAGTHVTATNEHQEAIIFSSEYSLSKLTLSAEYFRFKGKYEYEADQPYNETLAALIGFTGIPDLNMDAGAWYAQANYQFTNWFAALLSYGEYYSDWHDKKGDDLDPDVEKATAYQKDLQLALRFDLNSNWNIKVEAHSIDGTAECYEEVTENKWNFYALKTSFYF
ncbi:hypothetical protein JXQ70_08395 [bacterium]|nr:hypothetical protein [bacterium]